jgi:hypothetical protein
MPKRKIAINRAPVLTFWAAVVAERRGYDWPEALTLGRGLAGLNAQSKGRRLGIYEEKKDKTAGKARQPERGVKLQAVRIMGREVPAMRTAKGLRAAAGDKAIESDSVQTYLEQKFGDDLGAARAAMETLAKAYPRAQLETIAYSLYEKFRPAIPEGKKGWGVKGELDLDLITSLASKT